MRSRITAALLALGCSTAMAQQMTLGREGMDIVLVWKDAKAMDEGFALIRAGVNKTNPGLFRSLLSCPAMKGDRAVILDRGVATHTIMIVDGPRAGCRGDVAVEDVK